MIPETPNIHGEDVLHGSTEAGSEVISARESEEEIMSISTRSRRSTESSKRSG